MMSTMSPVVLTNILDSNRKYLYWRENICTRNISKNTAETSEMNIFHWHIVFLLWVSDAWKYVWSKVQWWMVDGGVPSFYNTTQDDEYSSCIICQHTTRSILRFCITEQACAAFYILTTSLENLLKSSRSPSEVLLESSWNPLEVL